MTLSLYLSRFVSSLSDHVQASSSFNWFSRVTKDVKPRKQTAANPSGEGIMSETVCYFT
jgi:hypothetical protein